MPYSILGSQLQRSQSVNSSLLLQVPPQKVFGPLKPTPVIQFPEGTCCSPSPKPLQVWLQVAQKERILLDQPGTGPGQTSQLRWAEGVQALQTRCEQSIQERLRRALTGD